MVDIQAKEVIDKISNELKIQPALKIPRKIKEDIQLIYNVNPERIVRHVEGSGANTTHRLVHTAHSKKRTFLIGGQISVSKDANNLSEKLRMHCLPKGSASINFLSIELTSGVAAQGITESVSLIHGIELEKDSEIGISLTESTAEVAISGIAYIYELDEL